MSTQPEEQDLTLADTLAKVPGYICEEVRTSLLEAKTLDVFDIENWLGPNQVRFYFDGPVVGDKGKTKLRVVQHFLGSYVMEWVTKSHREKYRGPTLSAIAKVLGTSEIELDECVKDCAWDPIPVVTELAGAVSVTPPAGKASLKLVLEPGLATRLGHYFAGMSEKGSQSNQLAAGACLALTDFNFQPAYPALLIYAPKGTGIKALGHATVQLFQKNHPTLRAEFVRAHDFLGDYTSACGHGGKGQSLFPDFLAFNQHYVDRKLKLLVVEGIEAIGRKAVGTQDALLGVIQSLLSRKRDGRLVISTSLALDDKPGGLFEPERWNPRMLEILQEGLAPRLALQLLDKDDQRTLAEEMVARSLAPYGLVEGGVDLLVRFCQPSAMSAAVSTIRFKQKCLNYQLGFDELLSLLGVNAEQLAAETPKVKITLVNMLELIQFCLDDRQWNWNKFKLEALRSKSKGRPLAACRHDLMYLGRRYLPANVSDDEIANSLGRDRTMAIYAYQKRSKEASSGKLDPLLLGLIDRIETHFDVPTVQPLSGGLC